MNSAAEIKRLAVLDVPLERDGFLRSLVRHLSGALQDVVGLKEASGFVTLVGQRMGDEINAAYKSGLAVNALSREQVSAVLVDLKRRIQGDFYVIDETVDKIVLGNRACPFGDRVWDRPALCMMTSNVFGRIASENLGYAKVAIDRSIARRDSECRVVIYLEPTDEARAADGREYIKG
ncbi:MAG TPA: methanogen output domain 1-containing protein [Gemmatimonadaceae bacterium]|nr:methanogen output domain 1-containing protein [Gemmatimonadaceae bacterium]